jgi:protein-disulfide isomerase
MESNTDTSGAKTLYDKYGMPLAVFLGLALIASALYFGDGAPRQMVENNGGQGVLQEEGSLDALAPITAEDHIRGNRNADVIIVEFSDTECPFCKLFHETMKQVMSEYGASGKVAWVYRHFPLDSLHQKARSEAVALECAAELGGNDAFWAYTDLVYQTTTSNDGLDAAELPKIAGAVGLDVAAFSSCLTSGRHDAAVQADVEDAIASGGRGTPWSIIVTKSGQKFPLSGAQPIDAVRQAIDSALSN